MSLTPLKIKIIKLGFVVVEFIVEIVLVMDMGVVVLIVEVMSLGCSDSRDLILRDY